MPGARRAAIGEEATLAEVVTAAIAAGVDRLLANEAIHRGDEGDRVKAVHQMRVATRRLRSDLRTFRSVLDPGWAGELRVELGWLAGLLGAARDADVLYERLSARSSELAREQAEGAAQLIAALAGQRARAHAELREALADDRYGLLRGRLRSSAASPALKSCGEASRTAGEALPAIVRRSWHRLERKAGSLGALSTNGERRLGRKAGSPARPPTDKELHEVRIFAKRCRYAAEACAPALGAPAERVARACKRLQTVLGELNDAAVAEGWLRSWAAEARSPASAAAAQELANRERAAARKARARWAKAWERAEMAEMEVRPSD